MVSDLKLVPVYDPIKCDGVWPGTTEMVDAGVMAYNTSESGTCEMLMQIYNAMVKTAPVVKQSRTPDPLIAEMRAWMEGIMDRSDEIRNGNSLRERCADAEAWYKKGRALLAKLPAAEEL